METAQQCDVDIGDVTDREEEFPVEEVGSVEEVANIRLLRSIFGASSRPKIEVPTYESSLNVEELVDWVSAMNKYFKYEEVDEEKRVKFAVTRWRGHATLWWDGVQVERKNKGKAKITDWNMMVAKLEGKFFPKDYHLS
jgi:hypothetical protein